MTNQLNTVTAAPTWAFTPLTGVGAPVQTCMLVNNGVNPAYFGGSALTVSNGTPILPGQVVRLEKCTAPVYLCSGFATTATNAVTSTAYAAGTTTLVMASTALTTGMTGGTSTATVQVGTASSSEVVSATLTYQSATVTTTALNYDHKSGATCTLVTSAIVQVGVTPGVL